LHVQNFSGIGAFLEKLVERCHDKLFSNISLNNQFNVLNNFLPEETVLPFKCRPHNSQLIKKTSRLADASFIVRILYKDIY